MSLFVSPPSRAAAKSDMRRAELLLPLLAWRAYLLLSLPPFSDYQQRETCIREKSLLSFQTESLLLLLLRNVVGMPLFKDRKRAKKGTKSGSRPLRTS